MKIHLEKVVCGLWKRLKASIFERKSSIETSSLEVRNSKAHFRRRELLVLFSCILISDVSKGESHPIRFPLSSDDIKGESEKFLIPETQSLPSASQNGRIPMNNSESFSQISGSATKDSTDLVSRIDFSARNGFDENYTSRNGVLLSRRKRGFFDKEQEKQRLEEEYDRSFRLFWFLGGVAIVFFILIFILTLLCFCCPNLANNKNKRKESNSVPRISIPTVHGPGVDGVGLSYEPSPCRADVEMRMRSASVFSVNGPYVPHHRLSQEQVNAIQLQSQSRRNSALPSTSQGQGLLPTTALIDVNVIQEFRPEKS